MDSVVRRLAVTALAVASAYATPRAAVPRHGLCRQVAG